MSVNEFRLFINDILNNQVILKEAREVFKIKNIHNLKQKLEVVTIISLFIYLSGGRLEYVGQHGSLADFLYEAFNKVLIKYPLFKNLVNRRWKNLKLQIHRLIDKGYFSLGDFYFYRVRAVKNKLIFEITDTFRSLATKLNISVYENIVSELFVKTEESKKENVQEQPKKTEGDPLEQLTPEERRKLKRIESKLVSLGDFVSILMKSIEVYTPFDIHKTNIPLLKYIYNKTEGQIKKGNLFFLYINLEELIRWAKATKIYEVIPLYSNLEPDEAAKHYVLNRLLEIFESEEDAFYRVTSIAINKILEKVYQALSARIKNLPPYEDFIKYIFRVQTNEVTTTLLSIIRNPNFIFIVPKEILEKLKYSDVLCQTSGIFILEDTTNVLETYKFFQCEDCRRYFVSSYREKIEYDEIEGKKKKVLEKPTCVFCKSDNVEEIPISRENIKTLFYSYVRTDSQVSEKIYLFGSVGEMLGTTLDAENTPLLMVAFPQLEKKGASPVKRIIPIVVGIIDKSIVESEKEIKEMADKVVNILDRVKDPLTKLRILARGVNVSQNTKILTYVDYAIAAHLIALATSTNKEIVLDILNGEDFIEVASNIKPSINFINIGESGAAKSTIKEKLVSVFPEKVFSYSLFKFTARQLSGYVSIQRPRKSILLSMNNKMLILDEATYAREEEVFAVFRDILESGKLDKENTINTVIGFLMNDPLNVNLGAIKGLKGFKDAYNLAISIKREYGDFNNILTGLYSYMMLALISLAFTKPFLERMRMFIISREYSKVYKDLLEATKKYRDEILELKKKDLLPSAKEVRAYFMKYVFPISRIVVREEAFRLIDKYAKYFAIIFRKLGEKMDYVFREMKAISRPLLSELDISEERIRNALILIASGIAKITRPLSAEEEDEKLTIEILPEDVKIAKYFLVTFAPDYLHEIAMKQLDELFKYLDSIEKPEKVEWEDMISVLSVVTQNIKPEVEIREEATKPNITTEDLTEIIHYVIWESYNRQEEYINLIEAAIKAQLGVANELVIKEVTDKVLDIMQKLQERNYISVYKGKVVDIPEKKLAIKKHLKAIIYSLMEK